MLIAQGDPIDLHPAKRPLPRNPKQRTPVGAEVQEKSECASNELKACYRVSPFFASGGPVSFEPQSRTISDQQAAKNSVSSPVTEPVFWAQQTQQKPLNAALFWTGFAPGFLRRPCVQESQIRRTGERLEGKKNALLDGISSNLVNHRFTFWSNQDRLYIAPFSSHFLQAESRAKASLLQPFDPLKRRLCILENARFSEANRADYRCCSSNQKRGGNGQFDPASSLHFGIFKNFFYLLQMQMVVG